MFGAAGEFQQPVEEKFTRSSIGRCQFFATIFAARLAPEHIAFRAGGVEKAVAEKDEESPGAAWKANCSCSAVSKRPRGSPDGFDAFDLSLVAINGARQSAVRDLQVALLVLPDSISKRRRTAPRLGRSASDMLIRKSMSAAPGAVGGMRAKESADEGRVERGGWTLTANVSDGDTQAVGAVPPGLGGY